MPDNKNNDDLYIEEDLAADFLSEADLDGEISALTDTPAGTPPAEQPASDSPPVAPAEAPDGAAASSDTGDWVEDERVDLPGPVGAGYLRNQGRSWSSFAG